MKYHIVLLFIIQISFTAYTQDIFSPSRDQGIPRDVEAIYKKGLSFIAKTQNEKGSWDNSYGRTLLVEHR